MRSLHSRPRELLVLLALGFVQFIVSLDYIIIMPLGPRLRELFSIATEQFDLAVVV